MVEWVTLQPIFDVCVREMGYEGGGKLWGAALEAGGSGESAEGHSRINFGSGKGAPATGIQMARQEQGGVGGGERGKRRIGARHGTLVCWDGYR